MFCSNVAVDSICMGVRNNTWIAEASLLTVPALIIVVRIGHRLALTMLSELDELLMTSTYLIFMDIFADPSLTP